MPNRKGADGRGNDLISGRVGEGGRQCRPVERVVDRAAQADVAKQGPMSVEGNRVDDGPSIAEVLLLAGSGSRAPRALAPVEDAADGHQRRRVVEVPRQDVGGPAIGERDGRRRGDVVRVHDPLGVPRPTAGIVWIPLEHGALALDRVDVVRARRGDRMLGEPVDVNRDG